MKKGIILKNNFFENSKVKSLEVILGFEGIRSLQILWLHCAEFYPDEADTILNDCSSWDIEFAAGWSGESGKLYHCLLGEWIEKTENGHRLLGRGEIFDFYSED